MGTLRDSLRTLRDYSSDVLTMALLGFIGGLAAIGGLWWLVVGLVMLAFLLGLASEERRSARAHLVAQLEAFTDWAEFMLVSAPNDELSAEYELVRQRLQNEYHQAQDLLGRLR